MKFENRKQNIIPLFAGFFKHRLKFIYISEAGSRSCCRHAHKEKWPSHNIIRCRYSLVTTDFFIFLALNIKPRELKLYTRSQIPAVLNAYLDGNDVIDPLPFVAAASVLPMRANNYVVEELIDWSNIPDDPIFQLVFPQPGMFISFYLLLKGGNNKKFVPIMTDLENLNSQPSTIINSLYRIHRMNLFFLPEKKPQPQAGLWFIPLTR